MKRPFAWLAAMLAVVMLTAAFPASLLAESMETEALHTLQALEERQDEAPEEQEEGPEAPDGTEEEEPEEEASQSEVEPESGPAQVSSGASSSSVAEPAASSSSEAGESSMAGQSSAVTSVLPERMLTGFGVLDALDTYDAAHLKQLIEDSDDGTIELDGNFTIDETIGIDEALTIKGGDYTITTTHGGRHFRVDVAAGEVGFERLTLKAENGGGGIEAAGNGALELALTEVTADGLDNEAVDGGVVSGRGNAELTIVLYDCVLTNNKARNGGAVYNELGAVRLDSINNRLHDNHAAENGGAICARQVNVSGGELNGNGATAGGAIYVKDEITAPGEVALLVYAGTLSGNAAAQGGAVYVDSHAKVQIGEATFTGNNATEGGAIWAKTENNSSFTVAGALIDSNDANLGGGIWASPDVTLTGATVKDNTAYQGGGVYATSQIRLQSGTVVADNKAEHQGGGVYNAGIEEGDLVYVLQSTMFGNKALDDTGGAIYMQHFSRIYTMQSEFYGNYAYITATWNQRTDDYYYEHHPTNALVSDILYTTNTDPFPNIYNGADISFDSEDTDNGKAVVYTVELITGDGVWADGEASDRLVRVPEEYPVGLPSAVAKHGIEPEGWYRDASFTQSWDIEKDIVTGDMTLYAKWPSYEVSFVLDGAPYGDPLTVALGDMLAEPVMTNTPDYVFNGWYTDGEMTQSYSFGGLVTADMALYAEWQFVGLTVTFMINDVFYKEETGIKYGQPVAKPVLANPEGYTLDDWHADEALTVEWDFGDPVMGNMELYSEWDFDGWEVEYWVATDGGTYELYGSFTHFEHSAPIYDRGYQRDGYEFDGWYYDEDLEEPWNFNDPVGEDLELYGTATFVGHTVTYYLDGGQYGSPEEGVKGAATLPNVPEREGYELDGWYTDPGYTEKWTLTDTVTRSMDLYARFLFDGYEVYFYIDGEQYGDMLFLEEQGMTVDKPAVRARDGWELGGWRKDDGTEWKFSDPVAEDLELYAVWDYVGYRVNFYVDGVLEDVAQELDKGDKAIAPDVAIDPGYGLDGWYLNITRTRAWDMEAGIQGSMDLYAVTRFEGFKVEFVIDGEVVEAYTTTDPDEILEAPKLTSEDGRYESDGWYHDPGLTIPYEFDEPVDGDLTLYGEWVFKGDIVEFYIDGVLDDTLTTKDPAQTLEEPDTDARKGYRLDGWYQDEAGKLPYAFGGTLNGDLKLYAFWEFLGFNVEYIIDGKTVGKYTTESPDERLEAPKLTSEDGRYESGGWYTDPGLTKPYEFGELVEDDLKLYGEWVFKGYEVEYVIDGETVYTYTTKDPDEQLQEPGAITSKDGQYESGGWYTDPGLTKPYEFGGLVEGDLKLYGEWIHLGYDVYYILDGEVYDTFKSPAGVALLAPDPAPEKEGHSFGGWRVGTMEDIPVLAVPTAARALAAPMATEDVLIVYWDFDNDMTPEDTLVLVGDFTALVVEESSSAPSGTSSGNSSSSSTAGGTSTSGSRRSTSYSYMNGVRTGDESMLLWFTAAALVMGGALVGLILWRKRQNMK